MYWITSLRHSRCENPMDPSRPTFGEQNESKLWSFVFLSFLFRFGRIEQWSHQVGLALRLLAGFFQCFFFFLTQSFNEIRAQKPRCVDTFNNFSQIHFYSKSYVNTFKCFGSHDVRYGCFFVSIFAGAFYHFHRIPNHTTISFHVW